jgi:hypothetical protein
MKEFPLDKHNIPDFFMDGIAVEVKIKGSKKNIYRQLERYAGFDLVKEIILVTNRTLGLPEKINGKPCYMFKLGTAWL